ncbi:MAG: hypothetical protein HGB35_01010 [Geobacteraceae bacterium]|nr:hypothetical protein [Geobacteraceae bacterium]
MMKAVTYIEIDLPVCSRAFSVSPCLAQYQPSQIVGVQTFDNEGIITSYASADDEGLLSAYASSDDEGMMLGGGECYKTIVTCHNLSNYSGSIKTVRFGYADADDQSGIDYIPSLKSVSFKPQQVSLGENLGVRASLTVSFMDHRFPETHNAGDPYWKTRGYDPYAVGSFWGKFRSRFAYMQGLEIRMVTGYEGQAVSEMESRTFIVEKITGPSLDGKVTITAKDVLKLLDEEKAQCPVLSTGRLAADITSTSTTCTLSASGVGDKEYPSSGHVAIGGKEICAFTRTGDALILTRAQFGTEAISHDQSDLVQLCYEVFDENGNGLDPADILYDWFTGYSAISSSWITLDDWRTRTDQYIGRLYYGLIAEPTAVRKLANELIKQTGLIIYTDDVNKKIRLDVVRQLTDAISLIDEDVWVQGSFDVTDQPDKRLSQVWVYYGVRNPLESLTEAKNFTAAVAAVDPDIEAANNNTPAIEKIYSRFIPKNNRPAASDLAYRILARFRTPPRSFEFDVWRRGDISVSLAKHCNLTAWPLQLPSGEQKAIPVQITELNPGDAAISAKAQEISWYKYDDLPDQGLLVVIDSDSVDINFRDEYDKSYNPPESGKTVTCLVESGVIIGASSTSTYAFSVGSWPSGVTLKIVNNGRIVGKGGVGGIGGGTNTGGPGLNGGNGGNAFKASQSVEVENNGLIASGGGGGGGGSAIGSNQNAGGGGGGAGRGYTATLGGSGGIGNPAGQNGANGGTGNESGYGTGGTGCDLALAKGGDGGNGGGYGQLGSNGIRGTGFGTYYAPGTGGAPGIAIDGYSYLILTGTGSIIGTTQG